MPTTQTQDLSLELSLPLLACHDPPRLGRQFQLTAGRPPVLVGDPARHFEAIEREGRKAREREQREARVHDSPEVNTEHRAPGASGAQSGVPPPPPADWELPADWVAQLVDMGLSAEAASLAIRSSGCRGIAEAADWHFARPRPADLAPTNVPPASSQPEVSPLFDL